MFERLFRYYTYPFEIADEMLADMSEVERSRYLESISNWVESKAYKTEMSEIVRSVYREMATKAQDKTQFTGYRLSLILVKRLDQRFLTLNEQYKGIKKVREINESLN